MWRTESPANPRRKSEPSPSLAGQKIRPVVVDGSKRLGSGLRKHSHNNPHLSLSAYYQYDTTRPSPIAMSAKPLIYCIGSAAVGGVVELTYGSSLVSAHGSQLAAFTPAVLIGTGFWSLMHGFEVGKARTKYAELAKKDGESDVDERYSLP